MQITVNRGELKQACAGFSKIVNGRSQSLPILARLTLFDGKSAIFLRFRLKGLPHILFSALRVSGEVDPAT